jgi:putative transposase
MEQQMVRNTFKEKLPPTPEQERALDAVVWRCRDLYNTALEQRITAYQRRRVSVSRFEQEAELKDIRAEMSEYAAIHSHIVQDVLARLEKTYQAFFRRIQRGEKAGFPPLQGAQSLPLLHLQGVREWGYARQWLSGSIEDWANCHPLESPN